MSGGAEDAWKKLGLERTIGIVVGVIASTSQVINSCVQQYSTLEETRRMNVHLMRKDMLDYKMASDVSAATKQAVEAAKQAAEAAESGR